MKISLQTLGTRGDVQPFLALAIGLRNAGHEVSLAASKEYGNWITGHGIHHVPLLSDITSLLRTPDGKEAVSGRLAFLPKARLFRSFSDTLPDLLEAQRGAAAGADAIVFHPKALGGRHIAEAFGIPGFEALPLPALTPTSAFPTPVAPFENLGPLNRFSHRVAASAPEVLFAKAVRRFRNSLGLRPGRCTARIVQLHAYSEHVVPRPADFGDEAIICGFWTLGEGADWTPPADLAEFLEAGLAPVYVGFGSIPSIDPAHVTRMVCAALERTGQRGIISTGGGGLEACAVSDAILCIEEAPHEWLFPRVAAVVHHGGSGTVAASLCAGKASVVCPKFGDQPFWARRLQALGAAPEPLPFRLLSAESLAVRLETVAAQPEYARRAGSIGQLLRREDGVARAVLEIERVLADRSAPR